MPAKKDRCVAQVKRRMTKEYREETGHAPSKEKKEKIEESAWRICTNVLGTQEEVI